METIIVGDIHGHIASVEAALAFDGNVVFVGDYLDSYTYSPEDQVMCLRAVLGAIESEPDRVTGLIGNHEISYLYDDQRCSGYNGSTAQLVKHHHERMKNKLKSYHWVGDWLITHAGVSQVLLNARHQTLDEYLAGGEFLQIGMSRGGFDVCGGLHWCDFLDDMVPPDNLKQVFGHSNRARGIYKYTDGIRQMMSYEGTGEAWCVDNLARVPEVALIGSDGDLRSHRLPIDDRAASHQ